MNQGSRCNRFAVIDPMKRYFFDIRDGEELIDHPFRHMAIEVRDDDGPVLEATFHWKLRLIGH